jgi:hypothetical protein
LKKEYFGQSQGTEPFITEGGAWIFLNKLFPKLSEKHFVSSR